MIGKRYLKAFDESAENGPVHGLRTIGSSEQEDMFRVCLHTIDLLKKLAHDLSGKRVIFPNSTVRGNDIQLIEEQDARGMRPRSLEDLLHPVTTLAEIVGLQVSCRCCEEGQPTLIGERSSDLCLACTRRPLQEQRAWDGYALRAPLLGVT